jgi:hypothetical protein
MLTDLIVKEEMHSMPMVEKSKNTTFDTLSANTSHRMSMQTVFDQQLLKQLLRDVGREKLGPGFHYYHLQRVHQVE